MRGIAASWVITGDAEVAPIERGAVVLDDAGGVVAVGEASALQREHGSARWEQTRAVLLPGLVNAHTHLELSALRGEAAGGRGFVPWVDGMLEARIRKHPEQDEEAIDAAVSELLASGTAAVGEVTNSLAAVSSLGSAPLVGRVFHEVFGMRRETGEGMIASARATRGARGDWPANLSYVLAPHTTYTLHPDVLRSVLADARAQRALTSIHLCEHAAERRYLLDGSGPFADFVRARSGGAASDWQPPGISPVHYAAKLGALAPDVLAVHLCDATPEELREVAGANARVVLCPRSNLHIQVKLPPLHAMLEAGLRPGLGTDSLASNTTLDVLEEARSLAERFPAVKPRTLLAMATSWGADALGFGRLLGKVAPGFAPGLVAFEHGSAPAPADPERFVLSRAARERTVLARPMARIPEDA